MGGQHVRRDKRAANGAPMEWLRNHVDHAGRECLFWPFSTIRGYGSVFFEGRTQTASRVMCVLRNGPAPDQGMDAAHTCGNGHIGCTNPNHLRWATRSENAADMIRHGTHRRGESIPNSKITEADARNIKRLLRSGLSISKTAKATGIGYWTVASIRQGRRWGWVE